MAKRFSKSELQRLRRAAGLSQSKLALRAGLSLNAIRYLEGGERKSPSADTVVRIAGTLGVPMEALFEDADDEEPVRVPRQFGHLQLAWSAS